MLEKRQSFTFVWGFSGGDSTALKSCTAVTMFVSRDAQNGSSQQAVPPFTIIAYPDQGAPTVDFLGSNVDNLPWTPRFPAGTKILINVVDAQGNSGGVAQQLYTLGSGISTSCIPSNPTSSLTASIDGVSGTIQTCDILPIRIQGGTKPYTVTIAATNAATAVNTTLDASNDYFEWINRSAPGQSMIAAISDSSGQYAASTQFYTTGGSADITCGGQVSRQSVFGSSSESAAPSSIRSTSSSGAAATTSAAADDGNKGTNTKSLTGAIIGTILGLLVVFGVIAYIFFKKRNSRVKYGEESSGGGGGGFGMKDYKRGGNMPGNESFLPLHESESLPRTPVLGDQQAYAPRRQSNMDYYQAPPSNFSGTAPSMGTSAAGSGSGTGPSYSTMGSPPSAAIGLGVAGVAAQPQTKREMMAAEQLRRQQWNAANQPYVRPESMQPPASSYSVNPFGDNTYPAQPTHSHGPISSLGGSVAYATGAPAPYQPSHVGTGTAPRPSGSQDLTTMTAIPLSAAAAPASTAGMTPAARAKAAEAAQERRAHPDEDDDDLLAYTQPRMLLGVTNPDRASVATTNTMASADPYGGTASHASMVSARGGMNTPTQVYQHEDAGDVVELPPAYREFSKTPAPGGGPPRL